MKCFFARSSFKSFLEALLTYLVLSIGISGISLPAHPAR